MRGARLAPLWLAAALALACARQELPAPPNLVLLIADDLGYLDHGFMGSPVVETPHLDALAREGTVLSHGYATSSICRPALRSLLTGLHPRQWDRRVLALQARGLAGRGDEVIGEFATLPRWLAARGYASFQAGKLWEASYRVAGFGDGLQRPGDDPSHGGAGRMLGRSLPLDAVAAFLDARRAQPFFLWFAPMLPHPPHDADRALQARYQGRGLPASAVRYYANVTRFDALVGELLGLLAERGLRERTLVVYLADNGWDQPPGLEVREGASDGPRGKNTLYEIGWRTPIVLSWPGVVPAGAVSDALVSTVDLVPTLLDYAGAALPAELPGRSLRGLVQEGVPWPREEVIGSLRGARQPSGARAEPLASGAAPPESFVLRSRERWYVWRPQLDREELYDAQGDPRAERDLAAAEPVRVQRFRSRVLRWTRALAPAETGTGPASPN
jgi:uncharacterized sulfatase